MKLPKFVVGITDVRRISRVHVLETYNAENEVIAAYLVAANELDIPFDDNDDRHEFSLEEAEEEFLDHGYSLKVIAL